MSFGVKTMPLHHHVSYICLQIYQTKQTLLQVDFKMHTHWMTIPISHIFMIQLVLTCGTKITKFFSAVCRTIKVKCIMLVISYLDYFLIIGESLQHRITEPSSNFTNARFPY